MDDLKFYCKYIVLNGEMVSYEQLADVLGGRRKIELTFNDAFHVYHSELSDDFFQLYIEYGSSLPHPDHVINTSLKRDEENPRSMNQIEPKQLFALIDIHKSLLWINNIKKVKAIEYYISAIGLKPEIKNIYNAEEFIGRLRSVNGIRISSTPERLFQETNLNTVLNSDIYGYGASSAILEFKYKKTRLLDNVTMENIKNLFSKRVSFETFVISGRDDQGVDFVFNNESLAEKMFLEVKPNDSGQYIVSNVFSALKGRLLNG